MTLQISDYKSCLNIRQQSTHVWEKTTELPEYQIGPTKDDINTSGTDSKGEKLRNVVTGQFEQNIVWWCKSGDNIQSRITWLHDNLE